MLLAKKNPEPQLKKKKQAQEEEEEVEGSPGEESSAAHGPIAEACDDAENGEGDSGENEVRESALRLAALAACGGAPEGLRYALDDLLECGQELVDANGHSALREAMHGTGALQAAKSLAAVDGLASNASALLAWLATNGVAE